MQLVHGLGSGNYLGHEDKCKLKSANQSRVLSVSLRTMHGVLKQLCLEKNISRGAQTQFLVGYE